MKKENPAPRSESEFVELEDLLSSIPEEHEALASDEADGFLTGLLLNPEEVPPERWMPYILDSRGEEVKELGKEPLFRLESLLFRRYREIDRALASRSPIDPVILIDEDEDPGSGLGPFASGFLLSMKLFPGLSAVRDKAVQGALLGILRHLPEEQRGDLGKTVAELDRDSPLKTPEEALDALAACAAEIAEVTRGFTIKD